MAEAPRMYPTPMPSYVRQNPLRSAECRVYDALQTQLKTPYVVFYSRPWLGLTASGAEIDGEADFVVGHPDHGFLCLEVKGGAVSRDGNSDQWYSRDRHGIQHRIRNPVAQARQSKYQILEKLKQLPYWKNRFVGAWYGVILPDSAKPRHDLGPDMPLSLFAFSGDMDRLGPWVTSRLHIDSDDRLEPLGTSGLAALEQLLAASFRLRTPLNAAMALEDISIKVLTEEQFHILAYLRRLDRAVIEGGAGSGKTVLAAELAVRLAAEGRRVLLTCFNRPLAEDLKVRMQSFEGLTVRGFHELCASLAPEGGSFDGPGLGERLFNFLLHAIEEGRAPRFDSIIVDEGQDFEEDWMAALELCLTDRGTLHVFADSNQQVYRKASIFVRGATPPFPLTRNLRNTRQIFSAAFRAYEGDRYTAAGPEGRDVEWIEAEHVSEILEQMAVALGKLTGPEEVPPGEIAVLVPEPGALLQSVRDRVARKYTVADAAAPLKDAITVDTVRRFKGLERRVVIIAGADQLLQSRELLYVALTRGRLHLIVIGSAHSLRQMRANVSNDAALSQTGS